MNSQAPINKLDLLIDAISIGLKKSLRSAGVLSVWITKMILTILPLLLGLIPMAFAPFLGLVPVTMTPLITFAPAHRILAFTFLGLTLIGITMLWHMFLETGFQKAMLKAYDTNATSLQDLFSATASQIIRITVASFLYLVCFCIGILLFIIPGILFAARCMFFPYLIIEHNMGPIDALKTSWHMTRGFSWVTLGLLLFTNLIKFLLPWYTISAIHIYRELYHAYQS